MKKRNFVVHFLSHTGRWRQISGWKCLKDVSLPPTHPLEGLFHQCDTELDGFQDKVFVKATHAVDTDGSWEHC